MKEINKRCRIVGAAVSTACLVAVAAFTSAAMAHSEETFVAAPPPPLPPPATVPTPDADDARRNRRSSNDNSRRLRPRRRRGRRQQDVDADADAYVDADGAVRGLLSRILHPSTVEYIELGPPLRRHGGGNDDAFEIVPGSVRGKVQVRGSSTSALTAGIGWYLRYGANVTLEWGDGDTGGRKRLWTLRPPLPDVPDSISGRTGSSVSWRYYLNVCTLGYSAVWWDWERWEKELDWMALRGINLPLAFVGQELIWERVFVKAGLNAADLDEFFSGPAFLPWNRMGNMRHFGGPLPESWRIKSSSLQKRILLRMRQLGMTPVLPAFAGHVPQALAKVGANVTKSPNWLSFPDEDCCVGLLEASDPLFAKLGRWVIEEMRSEWGGVDGVYAGDTFNEMGPPSLELGDLRSWGAAVYDGVRAGDEEGVWLLQGWLFLNAERWTQERIVAYLSGSPSDRTLVLDLNTDVRPQWERTKNFADRPWIWNMIENFGGRRNLQGNLTRIATGPIEDLAASGRMVGIGAAPEAIENNLAMFDMLFEMGWRTASPNVTEWVQSYATRRYGWPLHESAARAWDVLRAYAFSSYLQFHSPVECKPSMKAANFVGNSTAYVSAWFLLAKAAGDDPTNEPLLYDLVDVGRQVLVNTFSIMHARLVNSSDGCARSSQQSNCDDTVELAKKMLRLIDDLDTLMATNENFLLGRWLESARSWADDEEEAKLYKYNAKNQITWWGPNQNIADYASKPWAGLLGTYYKGRWSTFLAEVVAAAGDRREPNIKAATEAVTAAEQEWLKSDAVFPTEPVGDVIRVTERLLKQYGGPVAAIS